MQLEAPVLEPQFSTLEQQRGASVLGMWLFLATEVLLFGSIIAAFLATRVFYPHDLALHRCGLDLPAASAVSERSSRIDGPAFLRIFHE